MQQRSLFFPAKLSLLFAPLQLTLPTSACGGSRCVPPSLSAPSAPLSGFILQNYPPYRSQFRLWLTPPALKLRELTTFQRGFHLWLLPSHFRTDYQSWPQFLSLQYGTFYRVLQEGLSECLAPTHIAKLFLIQAHATKELFFALRLNDSDLPLFSVISFPPEASILRKPLDQVQPTPSGDAKQASPQLREASAQEVEMVAADGLAWAVTEGLWYVCQAKMFP